MTSSLMARSIGIDALLEPKFKHREFRELLLDSNREITVRHEELRELKKILVAILKSSGGEIVVKKETFDSVGPGDGFEVNDGNEDSIKVSFR